MTYIDPSGFYTEIIGWTGVGVGNSSFGHVSVLINGRSFSFGPGGLDIRAASDYLGRNKFRSGKGIILDLSPSEEASLAEYLMNYSKN